MTDDAWNAPVNPHISKMIHITPPTDPILKIDQIQPTHDQIMEYLHYCEKFYIEHNIEHVPVDEFYNVVMLEYWYELIRTHPTLLTGKNEKRIFLDMRSLIINGSRIRVDSEGNEYRTLKEHINFTIAPFFDTVDKKRRENRERVARYREAKKNPVVIKGWREYLEACRQRKEAIAALKLQRKQHLAQFDLYIAEEIDKWDKYVGDIRLRFNMVKKADR